jgi:hypothetical protein
MVDEHAICHEAGHAIVAMKFGLNVAEIRVEIRSRKPSSMFPVQRSSRHVRCLQAEQLPRNPRSAASVRGRVPIDGIFREWEVAG